MKGKMYFKISVYELLETIPEYKHATFILTQAKISTVRQEKRKQFVPKLHCNECVGFECLALILSNVPHTDTVRPILLEWQFTQAVE